MHLVLAHGCFDVLHSGHIAHLREARSLGDRLIVSVMPDHLVNKGPDRPVFPAAKRMEVLSSLDCVDEVVLCDGPDAVGVINRLRPAVFVKGIDYAGVESPGLAREAAAVKLVGGRLHITTTPKWSSTRVIMGERLSPEALAYLDRVKSCGYLDKIRSAFDAADKLKIAFVGETIIDEYRYVLPLAKPSKEFILATVEAKEPEVFFGGVVAASRHADWPNIKLVTPADTLTKTRYVDEDFSRKLFEVYSKRGLTLTREERALFQRQLIAAVHDSDVVIVFDFGHGLMGHAERRVVERNDHLAVNAQTNAGNQGFNPITKYARAHYICIDLPEARLAVQMPDETDVAVLAKEIRQDVFCERIVITQGRHGCGITDSIDGPDGALSRAIPSFATRAVDTIGAGDAFLAVTAPLVAAGLELEIAAFVGNVAGAIKTDIVGHRRHVGRAELMGGIEALLS